MYQWKRFSWSMGASLIMVFSIVITFWWSGIAVAIPIAGIGGFDIAADEIQMNQFQMLPKVGQTSERAMVPQASARLDAVIKNMKLSKIFNIPYFGKAVVIITAPREVTAQGLVLDLTQMAGDIQFNRLTIAEKNSKNPMEKFSLKSPTATLKHAHLTAHYLFANEISIPNMSFDLELNP